jgi:hypothetical protein
MPTTNEDLWPKLHFARAAATPLSILRDQAEFLTSDTNGTLRGEVETSAYGQRIAVDFSIVVPNLSGYKYTLFRISYSPTGPTSYPVAVETAPNPSPDRIHDEDDFRNFLRVTFNSEGVTRLLQNLYAQASA